MRTGEFIAILVALILANLSFFSKKKWILGAALLLIPNFFMMQALGEGFRWPMIVAYLALIPFFLSGGFRKEKMLGAYVGFHLVLMMAVGLLFLFPANDLPEPTGPFRVGTVDGVFENPDRRDPLAPEESESRRLGWQAWYPSQGYLEFPLAPWIKAGNRVGPLILKVGGLPGFLFQYLDQIKTSSRVGDLPLSNLAPYPLVIMSHGWLGFRNVHTNLAEEMASRGFVVLAIDHTYGALAVPFENEEYVEVNPEILPEGLTGEPFLEKAHILVSNYGMDIVDILGALRRGELVPKGLGDIINLNQVGLFGHSTGAGGGLWAAGTGGADIQALVSWDPWVEALRDDELSLGVKAPWLAIRSEAWEGKPNDVNFFKLLKDSVSGPEFLQAQGMKHWDMTQLYALSPLVKSLPQMGSLEALEGARGLIGETVRFFQAQLGRPLPMAIEHGLRPLWLKALWAGKE